MESGVSPVVSCKLPVPNQTLSTTIEWSRPKSDRISEECKKHDQSSNKLHILTTQDNIHDFYSHVSDMSSLIQRIVSPSLLINHSKCKSCNVSRQFRTETYSAAQFTRHVDAFKRSRTSPSSSTSSTYQLTLLRKQLNEQPERVIRLLDLAENDNLSNDEYIRLGRRGSLCVTREVRLFIN